MGISVHWHNCGCVKYNNDQLQLSTSAYFERISNEKYFKVSPSCRVSSVALATCSPAESVCPPCPEHAPPPLSELFPWQRCQDGHTWWNLPLIGEGENICFYFVTCRKNKQQPVRPWDVQLLLPHINWSIHYDLFFIGTVGIQNDCIILTGCYLELLKKTYGDHVNNSKAIPKYLFTNSHTTHTVWSRSLLSSRVLSTCQTRIFTKMLLISNIIFEWCAWACAHIWTLIKWSSGCTTCRRERFTL